MNPQIKQIITELFCIKEASLQDLQERLEQDYSIGRYTKKIKINNKVYIKPTRDFVSYYKSIRAVLINEEKYFNFLKIAYQCRERALKLPCTEQDILTINNNIKMNLVLLEVNYASSFETINLIPKIVKMCKEESDNFINFKGYNHKVSAPIEGLGFTNQQFVEFSAL